MTAFFSFLKPKNLAGRGSPWAGKYLPLVILVFLVGACAKTQEFATITELKPTEGPPTVLLMPVDVELSVLTAGGLQEPNAEWTELGTANLLRALDSQKNRTGFRFVDFDDGAGRFDAPALASFDQLEKLHGVVGNTIRVHKYLGLPLPAKGDRFDWSLGPSVQDLAASFEADYALFVYARQSFSSGGRKALQAFGFLAGIYVPGGQQLGFFSLVDLATGDVVWYNALVLDKANLREQDGADKFISWMFEEFPAVQ